MNASISFDWFHWFDLFRRLAFSDSDFSGTPEHGIGSDSQFCPLAVGHCDFVPFYTSARHLDCRQGPNATRQSGVDDLPGAGRRCRLRASVVRRSIFGKTNTTELFGTREHQVSMVFGMIRMFTILFLFDGLASWQICHPCRSPRLQSFIVGRILEALLGRRSAPCRRKF